MGTLNLREPLKVKEVEKTVNRCGSQQSVSLNSYIKICFNLLNLISPISSIYGVKSYTISYKLLFTIMSYRVTPLVHLDALVSFDLLQAISDRNFVFCKQRGCSTRWWMHSVPSRWRLICAGIFSKTVSFPRIFSARIAGRTGSVGDNNYADANRTGNKRDGRQVGGIPTERKTKQNNNNNHNNNNDVDDKKQNKNPVKRRPWKNLERNSWGDGRRSAACQPRRRDKRFGWSSNGGTAVLSLAE